MNLLYLPTLIGLALKYGPEALALFNAAKQYTPLAEALFNAIAPILQKQFGSMADATSHDLSNAVHMVLIRLGQPGLSSAEHAVLTQTFTEHEAMVSAV
jgi:hypothetical protein